VVCVVEEKHKVSVSAVVLVGAVKSVWKVEFDDPMKW